MTAQRFRARKRIEFLTTRIARLANMAQIESRNTVALHDTLPKERSKNTPRTNDVRSQDARPSPP